MSVVVCCAQTGSEKPDRCGAISFHKQAQRAQEPSNTTQHSCSTAVAAPAQCVIPNQPVEAIPLRKGVDPTTLPMFIQSDVQIALSPLRYCAQSELSLSKGDGTMFTDDEANSIEVYLHFFTRADGSGLSCALGHPCGVLRRRVIIRRHARERKLVGLIVPDSSASRYMVELKVCFCCCILECCE